MRRALPLSFPLYSEWDNRWSASFTFRAFSANPGDKQPGSAVPRFAH